ncbi:MAG: methylmalonyl-CoA carboxyltransferase [Candidatus Melainabacteria bacterium]|nr:MAG: methylmalonyl-CoA carboxyltransferase [Candidatus Melainabacteria bacterium]
MDPKEADPIALLKSKREAAKKADQSVKEKRQNQGQLLARERIEKLVDAGSFFELDRFALHRCHQFDMQKRLADGDGVITGQAKIDGRPIYLFAHDGTFLGGALGEVFAKKVCKIMDLALQAGCPVIGLNESGGARIQEGVNSLAGYADIFYRNVNSSGVIPQISVIMGACAGGAVYSPAVTDFTIMVAQQSYMFITGPDVVRTVTGEEISFEELGGAHIHNEKSGVAQLSAASEEEALKLVRKLLSYLPSNNLEKPPATPAHLARVPKNITELDNFIPVDPVKPYDMHGVIERIFDSGEFFEIAPSFAANLICGFARLEGQVVAVIANQPLVLAGTLDINASIKGARFLRFCDAFNIPVVTFVDVPGYLPGKQQEHGGIIRHGAKLLYAYCEATVPKLTVIVRKAYGGAFDVMGSKNVGGDFNFAWPTAEIAVMGVEGAVNLLYKKELKENQSRLKEIASQYRSGIANPYVAAQSGYIDDVIVPSETRHALLSALLAQTNKRLTRAPRKHGNIPL